MPKVSYCSVFVDDQERALGFYRDVLGFEVKHDVPMGEHRWLTLTGPGDPDGAQILLEPAEHPAVKPFRAALVEDGIPATAFEVDDVAGEVERLRARGVTVVQSATPAGPVRIAVVDDTCGNLIQLFSA